MVTCVTWAQTVAQAGVSFPGFGPPGRDNPPGTVQCDPACPETRPGRWTWRAWPGSGGPGRWRGGIGIIRRNRFLVDGTFSCEGDRQYDPPRGVFGGWDGLSASTHKNPGTPQEEYLEAKVTGIEFKAGEYIEFREPNAGGYGDPLERDPKAVREDVLDDFTTIELARDAYGVIFKDERTLEIDESATEARRNEIRASRNGQRGSLDDLFSRSEGRLRPSVSPTSEAGNRAFGMI